MAAQPALYRSGWGINPLFYRLCLGCDLEHPAGCRADLPVSRLDWSLPMAIRSLRCNRGIGSDMGAASKYSSPI